MSANIKLLIALLLGAAIGALVMRQTTNTEVKSTEHKEMTDSISKNLDEKRTLEMAKPLKLSKPLDFAKALSMVRNQQVELLLTSKVLYSYDNDTKRAIESWVMDKDDMLALLGVKEGVDLDTAVKGMRCYIGYHNDQSQGTVGYTLVCVPTGQDSTVIRRNNGTPNPNGFPEAIEYHMPCPRNCGVNNHPNDLSSPAAQSRRPK